MSLDRRPEWHPRNVPLHPSCPAVEWSTIWARPDAENCQADTLDRLLRREAFNEHGRRELGGFLNRSSGPALPAPAPLQLLR